MKSTATNTLGYTGTVTLSQYIGSKKIKIAQIHNTGGNSLFDFLSDCFVGDFDLAALNRPTKIMLLTYNEEVDSEGNVVRLSVNKASHGFLSLLSKPEKVYKPSIGATVRYSFIIPGDLLKSVEFTGIGLYNNAATDLDYENYAAFCKVDDKLDGSVISPSAILAVDWELSITNKNS